MSDREVQRKTTINEASFNSAKALPVVPDEVTYAVAIIMTGTRISNSLIHKGGSTCQHHRRYFLVLFLEGLILVTWLLPARTNN